MIRSYLSDIINDCKTQKEWKIQLTIAIIFTSSKDSNETRIMHAKGNNREIWWVVKQMKLLKNFLSLFCKDIKKDCKNQWKEVKLFLIELMYCITILKEHV